MYSYSIMQWLFFFYLYCFLGWCVESSYVSVKSRKLVNRGFMRGPFLPLYGSGAIMMLVVSMPFQDNPLLVYVAGCIGATILEYVTGVTMEALFQVRYWDYSQNKFNFQGHICLFTTLSWGFLTIIMTEVIHRPIEKFVLSLPQPLLSGMTYVLTAGIAADFALSFKAALDLRDVLIRMEKAKEELSHIRTRLDALEKKMSEGSLSGSIHRELQELRANYIKRVEERRRLGALRDFFQKALIAAHPSMYSERFKEALEELRQNLKDGTDKFSQD